MARLLSLRRRSRSAAGPSKASVRARSGAVYALTHPLRSGGLRRRSTGAGGRVPFGMRNIISALDKGKPVPEKCLNGRLLVLAAKKIPHTLHPAGTRSQIYVPALYEHTALHEIRAFEAERPAPPFTPPVREHAGCILCFFFLLFLWHGLRFHWFSGLSLPDPPFPARPEAWPALFGLDAARFTLSGEWRRAVTALSLHADGLHLLGNTVFGLIFFIPLCRRTGLGLGLSAAVLAGIAGNAFNAWGRSLWRDLPHLSLGFSTALFGGLGALCAVTAVDALLFQRQHDKRGELFSGGVLWPFARSLGIFLAAGLALLGFLGGGGEARTDYLAHIAGFFCGLAVGIALFPLDAALGRLSARKERSAQAAFGLAALALLAGGWVCALG